MSGTWHPCHLMGNLPKYTRYDLDLGIQSYCGPQAPSLDVCQVTSDSATLDPARILLPIFEREASRKFYGFSVFS